MSRDLNLLNPLLKERIEELLRLGGKECAPYVPYVTDTLRTLDEQKELYGKGRLVSTLTATGQYTPGEAKKYAKPLARKITWTLESNHRSGKACDVAFLDQHGKLSYKGDFAKLGAIGETLGLTWGGRWVKTPDRPHFELPVALELPPIQRHFAAEQEELFISKGFVTQKKDLDAPLTRGEFYVIVKRVYDSLNHNV